MERWGWICILLVAATPADTVGQDMAQSEVKALRQEIAELRLALAECENRLEAIEKRLPAPLWEPDEAVQSCRLALEGFCPVALVEDLEQNTPKWTRGDPEISLSFEGVEYYFSSNKAREKFFLNPFRYALVMQGCDVVIAKQESCRVPGIREYGARWRNQVYVFANKESYQAFQRSPEEFEAFAHGIALEQTQKDYRLVAWNCFLAAMPVRAAVVHGLLELQTGSFWNDRLGAVIDTGLSDDNKVGSSPEPGDREDATDGSGIEIDNETTVPWLADYFRARLHLLIPAE